MTLLALGDTHGRTNWKKIVANTTFDTVIFIGDYFDTHDNVSAQQQLTNFKEIIAYKRANSDKVILLIGNHDYHYIRPIEETYSGFQDDYAPEIGQLLHEAIGADLMQMCYRHDTYLFSHAGITQTWLTAVGYTGEEPIDSFINALFRTRPGAFRFTVGRNFSPYGDDVCQTPIWVRPKSLMQDAVVGYTQVVGHTTQQRLVINPVVTLIDTLGTSGQFLTIVNGKMKLGN